jgi:hypothetical protein
MRPLSTWLLPALLPLLLPPPQAAVVAALTAEPQPARACFPLLPPGVHAGVNGPGTTPKMAAAYSAIVKSGGDLAQIGVTWADVEPTKGQYDFSGLLSSLQWAQSQGQHAIVGVNAINTNVLSIPKDLLSKDGKNLRFGLTWSSPEIVQRYSLMVDQAARIAQLGGAVHFSVGNEVDGVLSSNKAMQYPFAEFIVYAKAAVTKATSAEMSVGVSYTWDAWKALRAVKAPWLDIMNNVTDGILLTWYPLQSNFSVMPPSVGADYFNEMVATLPDGKCVIQQELGYPSGYNNASSTDGSSPAAQAAFYAAALSGAKNLEPDAKRKLRGVMPFDLSDWTPATCEYFSQYYKVSSPAFVEYLCTLGITAADGTGKPALDVVEQGIRSLRT